MEELDVQDAELKPAARLIEDLGATKKTQLILRSICKMRSKSRFPMERKTTSLPFRTFYNSIRCANP